MTRLLLALKPPCLSHLHAFDLYRIIPRHGYVTLFPHAPWGRLPLRFGSLGLFRELVEGLQYVGPRHCGAGWWHRSGLVRLVTGDLVAVAVNSCYDIAAPLHSFDDCRGVSSVPPHRESARVAELLAQLKIVDQPLCVDGVAFGFRLGGSHWHSAPPKGRLPHVAYWPYAALARHMADNWLAAGRYTRQPLGA